MLHLIREKKLDLFDLDVNVLTDQYIAYLNSMQEMHLEVAGEYLAELASLIEYKSRKMIPGNEAELEEEEDPKQKLVKRLLEYQQYKEVSRQFEEMYEDRQTKISRPVLEEADQWMKESDEGHVTGTPYDLVKAMRKLLYRMQIETPKERSFEVKEISIEDRELEVRAKLDSLPDDISASWDAYGTTCYLCRLEGGNLHVVLEYTPPSGGTGIYWDVFTFPEDISEDRVTLSDAFGLLEHDCVVVSYRGYVDLPDSRLNDWINDYYSFDGDGNPILLARAYGDTAQIDLDGDGVDELCASSANTAQIFFQREDRLYEADVDQALENAWPEARSLGYEHWDVSRRNLTLYGQIPLSGQAFGAALRRAYFDGENLLIYQDHTTYTDHVADGIDVPDTVLSAAKDAVLSALDYWRGHTGAMGYADGQWQQVGTQAEWDDWRITELVLTDTVPAYPELGLRVYGLGYELHTTTPENIMLAGGMYMDEGGWVGGLSTLPPVLVFHTMADSGPVLLQSSIPNDVGRTSDNPMFAGCMAQVALENGLLTPSEVRPVDLYYLFYNNQGVFLNLMGAFPVEEQNTAFDALATYAAGVDEPGVNLLEESLQRLEESDYGLTEEGEMAELRLRNAWTRAQAEAERQALLAGQTQGDGTVYTAGSLSLWVPEGWADMAVVTAEDAVWSGGSVPGFDVYERLAHTSNPDTGLVWNLRALTRAQFQAAFGDADWSEILGASSYVIGSDDTYIYLLSTPTDVQFLVEDPTSMAQYELLRNQSQTVIEGFFFRNGITPNPDCPDADGCYVGPGASGRPEVNEAAKAAVQAAMDGILAPGAFSLTLSPAPGGSGGGSYILPLDMAAAISRMPENFLWYPAEAGSPPAGLASLTLTAEDGSTALQCWEGSSLVRCTRSGVTQWFYAPPVTADAVFNGTVFAALRQSYDDVEWFALREGIIIPDRGQSHLEIAQAWADADTQPALEVTDGSIFACTYVRTVADVDSWADMPETSYPEQSERHARFWFSYTRIFVPENEAARSWQMAGNTVEYDGRYGEAPEGAYENFQVGVLYLTDEGWRCDGTGTGP